jgi:hypothetical protein
LNYRRIIPHERFQFNQEFVKGHLRSDVWTLSEDMKNFIGPHQNFFEGQNHSGFPTHRHYTQAPQHKALTDNAKGEIYTIPRMYSHITKPTPMLTIGNFLLYFGLFLADTIKIGDKGFENRPRAGTRIQHSLEDAFIEGKSQDKSGILKRGQS